MPSIEVKAGPGTLTVGVSAPDSFDPRLIDYAVNFEVPVCRVEQEAQRIGRPDPEEDLP